MKLPRLLAYLWASPTSAVGLVLAGVALMSRGRARVLDGVLEVRGGLVGWLLARNPLVPGGVAAITFGHVVLGVDAARLDATRLHERVHVAQTERWGPLFLPLYLLSSLVCLCTRRDPYRDNRFEVEAYSIEAEARAAGLDVTSSSLAAAAARTRTSSR